MNGPMKVAHASRLGALVTHRGRSSRLGKLVAHRTLESLVALAALVVGGCTIDIDAPASLERPSFEQFKTVSPLLEQRCGSLDCHGNLARPLRVFGVRGMRYVNIFDPDQALELADPELARENGSFPGAGGKPTTEDEYAQNWRSACALEPEKMSRVARGELDPDELLLLRKPLGMEGHKGAALFVKGSSDHVCITSWLEGDVSNSECELSLKNP